MGFMRLVGFVHYGSTLQKLTYSKIKNELEHNTVIVSCTTMLLFDFIKI